MGTKPARRLDDYRGTIAIEELESIRATAAPLSGATAVHVNATSFGGGVAEILASLVHLMNDVGIRTDWRVLHGNPEFFEVTKKTHNALQGHPMSFAPEELALYEETNQRFAAFAFLDHDYVVIHDPQPCALVRYVEHDRPWLWRCHIDITQPDAQAWEFMQPFIESYGTMIISAELYRQPDLTIPQRIISPSIDPLSPKNIPLSEETIAAYIGRHGIPTDKPLITQVSRFDPWKDPEGVLQVYDLVRNEVDCRLAYCYNLANDDPEGVLILERMLKAAKPYLESGEVVFVRGDDPVLVNVLQRISSVIIQKSIREGFGLTVTEAMWKGTAVVASDVGGIPTQIEDGRTGYLVAPSDVWTFAERVIALLEEPELARQMGKRARESVRARFLITRHLQDYLQLLASH